MIECIDLLYHGGCSMKTHCTHRMCLPVLNADFRKYTPPCIDAECTDILYCGVCSTKCTDRMYLHLLIANLGKYISPCIHAECIDLLCHVE